jgi:integrase
MKLTQHTIDTGKIDTEGKSDFIAWDDELPGFGLRIREGGSRNWIVQYKIGTKNRRKTLGSVNELKLEQARKQAKKDLGAVANGADPQGEKVAKRATADETFGAVAHRYLEHRKGQLRPSSLYATTNYLINYCKRLHGLKIDAVTRREIASVVSSVAANHGKVAADRCGSSVSAMFSWAVREGLVENNPADELNKHAGVTKRERCLKDTELAALWLALPDNDYGRIVKLLMLTGQRKNEIAQLRWSEVTEDGIEISGSRTKNKRKHFVPLVASARKLIGKRQDDAERVFDLTNDSRPKRELDAELDIEPWVLHDLRRSFKTGIAELGVERHIRDAIQNHVKTGMDEIYNKAEYLKPKTEALELWANHIAVIVAKASGANVTRLRGKKAL